MKSESGLSQEFTQELLEHPELGSIAKRASTVLAEIAEEGTLIPVPVSARWSLSRRAKDHEISGISLVLTDEWGSVEFRTVPIVLSDESQLRYTLLRLWGDLLENRSHEMLKRQTNSVLAEG